MRRLLALLGVSAGLLLPALALVGPTAWLLPPAHLLFSALVVVGAFVEALAGHPGRARLWGLGYLITSIVAVGAMEFGSTVEGRAYWTVPWLILLLWGWAPPLAAGLSGWAAEAISAWRDRRVVRRRHAAGRPPRGQIADLDS